MTDTTAPHWSAPAAPRGLIGRAIGVIFSPRATYAAVAARPRSLGALALVILITCVATFAFLSTEVGQNAALDQQLTTMESFGRHPTAEQVQQMEAWAPISKYLAVLSQLVAIPLVTLLLAALALAVFNALLGGEATFKQVFAIVTHSWFITVLQTIFVLPLNYVRESMSSTTTSLAVFFPMLDDATFLARLLGSIDLFRIWWIVSLAIGFGVLFRRKTGPIAVTMLALYGLIAVTLAGIMTALSGA